MHVGRLNLRAGMSSTAPTRNRALPSWNRRGWRKPSSGSRRPRAVGTRGLCWRAAELCRPDLGLLEEQEEVLRVEARGHVHVVAAPMERDVHRDRVNARCDRPVDVEGAVPDAVRRETREGPPVARFVPLAGSGAQVSLRRPLHGPEHRASRRPKPGAGPMLCDSRRPDGSPGGAPLLARRWDERGGRPAGPPPRPDSPRD
jgi:hypothetical protein